MQTERRVPGVDGKKKRIDIAGERNFALGNWMCA